MTIRNLWRAKFLIPAIIVVAVGGGIVFATRSGQVDQSNLVTVKRGDIVQEVSVTGKVTPTENLDLAFERSGEVAKVLAQIGDKVSPGQQLVILKNADLASLVLQAQANLEAEQAKLSEFVKGTRPEELAAAETKVRNAENALHDAEVNLVNVQTKARVDLDNADNAAITEAQKAVTVGKNALFTLTDLQTAHFTGSSDENYKLAKAKEAAVEALLGQPNAGWWSTSSLSALSGGASGQVQNALLNPISQSIDGAVAATVDALQKVGSALEAVPIILQLTSTEKTNLTTEKSNISTELNTLTGKQQTVAAQKVTNANNLNAGQISLTTAQSTFASAEDDLTLKKAGSTPEQIAQQEARVKAATASLLNAQANLGKTIISSPIKGVVTKQDAKTGMIVTPNLPLVSIISDSPLEIKADVPEVDIAKVQVGNEASVTLDAYGNTMEFKSKVVFIEPAETVIQGVIYYKVTLIFEELDERLKPGMTANVNITTAKRENVLVVPQRSVIQEDGRTIVRVADSKDPQKYTKREVKTGLSGSSGLVEIVTGLREGETIITFLKSGK